MNKTELEEHLKEQDVLQVLSDTLDRLRRSPPGGAKIHKWKSKNSTLGFIVYRYEWGLEKKSIPSNETFCELKERDYERYSDSIDCVEEIINEYGVTI